MVNEIYQMKNEILQQAKKELNERGVERMDVDRLGAMIDMVHHLAESEASCWQAEYYRTVTEAMKKSDSMGYGTMGSPANGGGNLPRQGYSTMGARQGYMGSMGYDNLIDQVAQEYGNMTPEEKMLMKGKLLSRLGS